jgi:hypothetical protein
MIAMVKKSYSNQKLGKLIKIILIKIRVWNIFLKMNRKINKLMSQFINSKIIKAISITLKFKNKEKLANNLMILKLLNKCNNSSKI